MQQCPKGPTLISILIPRGGQRVDRISIPKYGHMHGTSASTQQNLSGGELDRI